MLSEYVSLYSCHHTSGTSISIIYEPQSFIDKKGFINVAATKKSDHIYQTNILLYKKMLTTPNWLILLFIKCCIRKIILGETIACVFFTGGGIVVYNSNVRMILSSSSSNLQTKVFLREKSFDFLGCSGAGINTPS